MSNDTKAFPTADVMSTITGRLMGDIDGVYQILNWMTGESVFTHQIPRISREAQPVIVGCRPELQQAIDEAEQVNGDNYRDWLATWTGRYGETIDVPKFGDAEHVAREPIAELVDMVGADRVIVAAEK